MKQVKVIALDADDTLWVNEPFFREAETAFGELLQDYLPAHSVGRELYATEMANLPLYGYGIKAFMLSMVETVGRITDGKAPYSLIERVLQLGRAMLEKPVELLDGVEEAVTHLSQHYRLVLATKGDLLDQERKLVKSGLGPHFHHIEVMSDKQPANYVKLLTALDVSAEHFLMVGNSLKSDSVPVLELGGWAAHIPFHITWEHERIAHAVTHERLLTLDRLTDLLPLLP